MYIKAFTSGPAATNCYLVGCEKTKHAVIIDAPPNSTSLILKELENQPYKVDKLLLTHSHWDHIADCAPLKEALTIPLYVHQADANNVTHPGSDRLFSPVPLTATTVEHLFKEGDQIEVGDLKFRVIHTPGHTPGCICLYCEEEGVLFSGDTLFRGSIGRLDLPTSDPEAMWPSLDKLAQLPSKTQVYSGHGPATTIGKEHWLPEARSYFGD